MSVAGAGGAEGRAAACRGGSATELAAGASLTFDDAELSSAGTVSSALAVCVRPTNSGCGAGCTEGGRSGILGVSRNGRGEAAERRIRLGRGLCPCSSCNGRSCGLRATRARRLGRLYCGCRRDLLLDLRRTLLHARSFRLHAESFRSEAPALTVICVIDPVVPVLALRCRCVWFGDAIFSVRATCRLQHQPCDQNKSERDRCEHCAAFSHANPPGSIERKRDATRCVSTRCVMPIGNCDWGLNALQIRQVSACTNLVLAVKQCLRVLPLALNSARKGNRLAIVLPLCCPSTCRGESGGTRQCLRSLTDASPGVSLHRRYFWWQRFLRPRLLVRRIFHGVPSWTMMATRNATTPPFSNAFRH